MLRVSLDTWPWRSSAADIEHFLSGICRHESHIIGPFRYVFLLLSFIFKDLSTDVCFLWLISSFFVQILFLLTVLLSVRVSGRSTPSDSFLLCQQFSAELLLAPCLLSISLDFIFFKALTLCNCLSISFLVLCLLCLNGVRRLGADILPSPHFLPHVAPSDTW